MEKPIKKFVICGIDTGVGKTMVSAILVEALQADYWKPIQSGELENTDTDTVRHLISNSNSVLHPEAYRLKLPMSPHASAEQEGVLITQEKIRIPDTSNPLFIELAGGIMVPLNYQILNLHLLQQWKLPVILVSRYYLGSINHTLLSVEVLRHYRVPIAGIIFSGEENRESKKAILQFSKAPLLGSVKQEERITKEVVKKYAIEFKPKLETL